MSEVRRKKLALVFPYAPAYRQAIYELIDDDFSPEWWFAGNAQRPLKQYDYSRLRKCSLSMRERKVAGPVERYSRFPAKELSDFQYLIMPGVIRNITIWKALIKAWLRPKTNPAIWLWTHGWYGKENWIERLIKKVYFALPAGVLVYGEYARNLMIDNGVKADKIKIIANSLDYDTQLALRNCITPSPVYREIFGNRDPVIIFLGRLTKCKELDRLINAVAMLDKNGPRCNLMLVGDGEMRQQLEQQVNDLSLNRRVHFAGASYDEQKNAEYIYNADVCVSPGNVGLTAIHTMMFGTPVLTHDTFKYQMPEFEAIRPGLTGDFFRFRDTDDMARSIAGWLSRHTDGRETIRRNCYAEIDGKWNPYAQMRTLHEIMG